MKTRLSAAVAAMVSCACMPLASIADEGAVPASLLPFPDGLGQGAESVRLADLRAWVTFLAAPELEGRRSGQRGYDVAARFCASVFAQLGLEPAGDAVNGRPTYFQRFNLVKDELDAESSFLELRAGDEPKRYPGAFAAPGRHPLDWDFQKLVFLGLDRHAVPDGAGGLDLAGKTLVVLGGKNGVDGGLRERFRSRPGSRILVISDRGVDENRRFRSREVLEASYQPAAAEGVQLAFASEAVGDALLEKSGWSVARLRELEGKDERLPALAIDSHELRLVRRVRAVRLPTVNVAARLEGADAKLKEQAVVVGAHLDHIGAEGGAIYHGADDDASGSAGVLALARAFAEAPKRPRRSVLFLLYGAEELGLLGSKHFVEQPPLPVERIVAKIQLDMIGRDEENERGGEKASENLNSVHVVGSRKRSLQLDRMIGDLNRSIGLQLEYDEERVFTRSDQYHFAMRGIPVAFFFTGFHRDYHQPGDTVDKVNFEKMRRIVQLVYLTAHSVADLPGALRKSERF
jgi:hypothetical protein